MFGQDVDQGLRYKKRTGVNSDLWRKTQYLNEVDARTDWAATLVHHLSSALSQSSLKAQQQPIVYASEILTTFDIINAR